MKILKTDSEWTLLLYENLLAFLLGTLTAKEFSQKIIALRHEFVDEVWTLDKTTTNRSKELVEKKLAGALTAQEFENAYRSLWGLEKMRLIEMVDELHALCNAYIECEERGEHSDPEQFMKQVKAFAARSITCSMI